MRNRSFVKCVAAFLCSVMVITSMGSGVYAADLISDVSDGQSADTISVEGTDEGGSLSVTDTGIDEIIVDASVADAIDADEIGVDTEDISVIGDGMIPDPVDISIDRGNDATQCFTVTNGVLGVDPAWGSLTRYTRDTGNSDFTIPAECTSIPASENLFLNNKSVSTVDFVRGGNGNLDIAVGAFKGCSLTSFWAESNYTTIKNETFSGCNKLEELTIRNVTKIGDYAFEGCTNLGTKAVTMPMVDDIGKYAFKGTGFVKLDISKIAANPGAPADIISEGAFSGCKSLESVTVPSFISVIPDYCFQDCTALNEIIVNGGTAEVGKFAFYGCTALKKIEKSKFNVSVVGDSAFCDCSELASVKLPESVGEIGNKAFDGCKSLVEIELWYKTLGKSTADDIVIDEEAFPAPIPAQATIRGMDGLVKIFAETTPHVFKKYESLLGTRKITTTANFAKCAKMTTSSKGTDGNPGAAPGTKVQITIATGTQVTSPRLIRNSLKAPHVDEFKFISGDYTKQVFEFEMPYEDVCIDADFYTDKADINGATITHGIEGEEFRWKPSLNKYSVDRPGYEGQVVVYADKDSKVEIGHWMFDYSSSNTNVAIISKTGLITALGTGDATITAKYRGAVSLTVKFVVNVGEATDVKSLTLTPVLDKIGGVTVETTDRVIDEVTYEDIPVIYFSKSELENKATSFKVILNASDGKYDDNYMIKTSWISGNTKLATVSAQQTINNENTVTVNKNILGETYIRAEYKITKKESMFAYLIVRVIDITPRLSDANIEVNSRKDADDGFGGTDVIIYPYKGYEIDTTTPITLLIGETPATTTQFTGVKAKWDLPGDGAVHINLNYNRLGNEAEPVVDTPGFEYTGKQTIYICGYYDPVGTATEGEYFKVPITKLSIVNKPQKLHATLSGFINLFYNSDCYDPQTVEGHLDELPKLNDDEKDDDYDLRYINATIGQVKVTNNILSSAARVKTAELWCVDKYKAYYDWYFDPRKDKDDFEYNEDDGFADNFDIMMDPLSDKDLIIRRSDNELVYEFVNGKYIPYTSGYLVLYLYGYTKPVIQAVKLPVKTAAPAYVLSSASTAEHVLNNNAVFKFKIIDKKSKRVVVKEESCKEIWTDEDSKLAFQDAEMDGEYVSLPAVPDTNFGKNTAVILVRRNNWASTMTFKYTVSYVEKKPGAKLLPSFAQLNLAYPDKADEIVLMLDQPNAQLSVVDDEFTFIAGPSDSISIDVDDGDFSSQKKITVKQDGGAIAGAYKYAFVPHYKCGDLEEDLKMMYLVIKVYDKTPVVKLSVGNYIFNLSYGAEYAEAPSTILTLSNLPAGQKYEDAEIDLTKAEFVPIAKVAPTAMQEAIGEALCFDKDYGDNGAYYDKDTKKFYAKVKMDVDGINKSFAYLFYVNGITVNDTEIKPNTLKIKVTGVFNTPIVAVGASGAINTIDYTTGVKCVPKFKYLSAPVLDGKDAITVLDMDRYGGNYHKKSTKIYAEQDEKDPSIVYLKAIHENGGDRESEIPDVNHRVRIKYTLTNGKSIETQKDIVIRPRQLMPALKTGTTKFVFHQGADDATGFKHRTRTTTLTKTSQLKTHITAVKIADSNPDLIKKAFVIEDYEESDDEKDAHDSDYKDVKTSTLYAGDIAITCRYPELLEVGKTYDIVLETEFDGQFWKRDKFGTILQRTKKDGTKENILTDGSKVTIQAVIKD
ncbi:MAG: leucine-rich repeat protein [Lachnospiraceae bacterium]|nr:leucine-rich repeat protein [Lachnospiraceae bacterium]